MTLLELIKKYENFDSALEQNYKNRYNIEGIIAWVNSNFGGSFTIDDVAKRDLSNITAEEFLAKGLASGLLARDYFNQQKLTLANKDLSNVEDSTFKEKASKSGVTGIIKDLSIAKIKSDLISKGIANPTPTQINEEWVKQVKSLIVTNENKDKNVWYTDIELNSESTYAVNGFFVPAGIENNKRGYTTLRFTSSSNLTQMVLFTIDDDNSFDTINRELTPDDVYYGIYGGSVPLFTSHVESQFSSIALDRLPDKYLVIGNYTPTILAGQCISFDKTGAGSIIASNSKYTSFDNLVKISNVDDWDSTTIAKIKAKLGI